MRRSEAKEQRREEDARPSKPSASDLRVPHDAQNESVLIAAACRSPERRRELLKLAGPECFFGKGHPEFWAALGELERRSLDYSLDSVAVLGAGTVDREYFARLLEIQEGAGEPPNLLFHVDRLKWDAQRIGAAHGPLQDLCDLFRQMAASPEQLAAKARQLADDLATAGGGGSVEDPRALLAENRAARASRRLGAAIYPYGLDGFERAPDGTWRVKPGLAPKTLTVFTGVSGSGKSVAAKRVALAQVRDFDRTPVLFGAWEEESGTVLEDLAWMALGYDRNLVGDGKLTPEQEEAMAREEERLLGFVRFLKRPREGKRDTNAGRVAWIASEVARTGVKVFVADLLDRVLPEDEVKDEARAFKLIADAAKATDAAFLVVHQQRLKDVEQRPDKRPTREGLKGSGAIIEASDTLIGFHRPGLWKSVDDASIEAIVLKQRRGRWPFSVEFDWDPNFASLTNGREVKYLRPGEDGGDVDGFIERNAGRGGGKWRR